MGETWDATQLTAYSGFEKFRTPEGRKVLTDAGRKALLKDMEAVEQLKDKELNNSRRS